MADLHGIPVWYGYFQYHDSRAFPMMGYGSGQYAGVVLSRQSVTPHEESLKLRPTGQKGSGPYFNAYKTGAYTVKAAAVLKTEGGTHPYINQCNWSDDWSTSSGGYTYRHVCRLYCNGEAVVTYNVSANTRSNGVHWAKFAAWKLQPGPMPAVGTWVQLMTYYNDSSAMVNFASIDAIVAKYEYFLWDVLSGVSIDPEITQGLSGYRVFQVRPGVESDPTDGLPLQFNHDELYSFEWWDLTGNMPGVYRELGGEAFYNACENLPKSFNNSVANILELASSVNSLIHGKFGKLVPSNIKDAWLFYRYQYTTTKLDLEEYTKLTQNLAAIAAMGSIRSDGEASKDGIKSHVYIEVDPSDIIPDDTKSWLQSYGVKLTAYDAWDMIPFSFVADWFLHIGDFLETMERENWAYSLKILDSWTSYRTFGPGAQVTYMRVPGYFRAKCPFVSYQSKSASGKTIVKRIADSIALFT